MGSRLLFVALFGFQGVPAEDAWAGDAPLRWHWGDQVRTYELSGRHLGRAFHLTHPRSGFVRGRDLTFELRLQCASTGGNARVDRVRCKIQEAVFEAEETVPHSYAGLPDPGPLAETLELWSDVLTGEHIDLRWSKSGRLRRIVLPTITGQSDRGAPMREYLLPALAAFDLELFDGGKTDQEDQSWSQAKPMMLASLVAQQGGGPRDLRARHLIEDQQGSLLRISTLGVGDSGSQRDDGGSSVGSSGVARPGGSASLLMGVYTVSKSFLLSESRFDRSRGELVSRWAHVEGYSALHLPQGPGNPEGPRVDQVDHMVVHLQLMPSASEDDRADTVW